MVEEENDKVDKEEDKEFDKEQNKVGDNKEVNLKRTLEKEKSGRTTRTRIKRKS